MGRTVPTFRWALAQEESEWKVYRNHLPKNERKDFDDMFAIPRKYLVPCSGAVKVTVFHPMAMSILFHHYLELKRLKLGLSDPEKLTIEQESLVNWNDDNSNSMTKWL